MHLSSQSMHRREHSALLQLCVYVFPPRKTIIATSKSFSSVALNMWNSMPNHLSEFQVFLLLEELSNITYSCLLTMTVVQNLVRLNQLNLSRCVIHLQLLLSHSSEIPCHPSKGVPSERLRLVKGFISPWLRTGAYVTLVLLTHLSHVTFRSITLCYPSLSYIIHEVT